VTRYWTIKIGGSEFKLMRLQDKPAETLADTPERIVAHLRTQLGGSLVYTPDVECFMIVLLNTRRRVIGWQVLSNGTIDTLLVHPREVFKAAILANAAALVIAHNHPSGDPTPSESDVKVTRDLIRAGQMMKIEVLDHVILGQPTAERAKDYASMRELGYFA
jgi:DNA repair protein RadC